MGALRPPVLSLFDPVTSGEGSVDPLSLQRTYERLADRILPAITVRMRRVRFVTAAAVAAHVCAEFDDEELAADKVSPPWLVCEWFVVEAFARCRDALAKTTGIPGIQKVEATIKKGNSVASPSYLRTPKVFGYTGIYKRLARALRITTDSIGLDDAGFELVREWERDQGLDGFIDQTTGPGASFRQALRKAVEKGLSVGHTVYQPSTFWQMITQHLRPDQIGKREAACLLRLLRQGDLRLASDPESPKMLVELLDAVGENGAPLLRHTEPEFLRGVAQHCSEELRRRLRIIDRYEALGRPIVDAFALMRYLSATAGGAAVDAKRFSQHELAGELAKQAAAAAKVALADSDLLEAVPESQSVAQRYVELSSGAELFDAVWEHHCQAQREKPPDGKRTWLESTPAGGVMVRPAYVVEDAPELNDLYVHEYRTPSLSQFLSDLGRIKA